MSETVRNSFNKDRVTIYSTHAVQEGCSDSRIAPEFIELRLERGQGELSQMGWWVGGGVVASE